MGHGGLPVLCQATGQRAVRDRSLLVDRCHGCCLPLYSSRLAAAHWRLPGGQRWGSQRRTAPQGHAAAPHGRQTSNYCTGLLLLARACLCGVQQVAGRDVHQRGPQPPAVLRHLLQRLLAAAHQHQGGALLRVSLRDRSACTAVRAGSVAGWAGWGSLNPRLAALEAADAPWTSQKRCRGRSEALQHPPTPLLPPVNRTTLPLSRAASPVMALSVRLS